MNSYAVARVRRRGAVVASVVAAGLLLVAAAILAPHAFAADDGRDVDWDLEGGASAYNSMIDGVRQRATGGRVARDGVLQTDPSATGFFTVNVGRVVNDNGLEIPRFRLIMRESDLFVLGFVNGDPDGDERVFFFRNDDNGYRGATTNATPVNMPFTGSYIDLERAGRDRVGITLNGAAWETATQTLERATADTPSRALAESLTPFIMAVAEGARFDTIQTAFAPSFNSNNGGSHTVTAVEAELMNNWRRASEQLFNSLNNAQPVNFVINDPATPEVDIEATTAAGLSVILAIALVIVSL